MPTNDAKGFIEDTLLFGLGVVSVTTEKVGQLMGDVLNINNLNIEEGKKNAYNVLDKSKLEVNRISDILKDSISKVLKEGELGRYFGTMGKGNKKH